MTSWLVGALAGPTRGAGREMILKAEWGSRDRSITHESQMIPDTCAGRCPVAGPETLSGRMMIRVTRNLEKYVVYYFESALRDEICRRRLEMRGALEGPTESCSPRSPTFPPSGS